jgi:predicted nuclease of predicted toxin-antitoxin system
MAKFILDVNVAHSVRKWENDDFEFQIFRNRKESDNDIWYYALINDLTIITKDSDFSYRMAQTEPPPRVIHLKLGNMKLKEFNTFIEVNWQKNEDLSVEYKLVRVHLDRFEAIN